MGSQGSERMCVAQREASHMQVDARVRPDAPRLEAVSGGYYCGRW